MKVWIHIGKQLLNSWRSQLAIGIELVLVFGVTWYMVNYFFVEIYNDHLPAGYEVDQVYQVRMTTLPAEDPAFQPAEEDTLHMQTNLQRVMDRIRAYPGVQSVGVSYGCSSWPYADCWNGNEVVNLSDTTRTSQVCQYCIHERSQFLEVFRYRSAVDGQLVRTEAFDWNDPHAVLITRQVEKDLMGEEVPAGASIGLKIQLSWSRTDHYLEIKGVLQDVKRFPDHLPQGYIFLPNGNNPQSVDDHGFFLRIDPKVAGAAFQQRFELDMARELRMGNLHLHSVQNFDDLLREHNLNWGNTYNWNIRVLLLGFLSLNILLCVMGTFWYRVSQRQGEIGLRMALGSTRGQVRRWMLCEGLCLLLLVTPVALFIEMQLAVAGFVDLPVSNPPAGYLPGIAWLRFLLTNLISWFLLAGVICLAIWLPATRAANEHPAVALGHDI